MRRYSPNATSLHKRDRTQKQRDKREAKARRLAERRAQRHEAAEALIAPQPQAVDSNA